MSTETGGAHDQLWQVLIDQGKGTREDIRAVSSKLDTFTTDMGKVLAEMTASQGKTNTEHGERLIALKTEFEGFKQITNSNFDEIKMASLNSLTDKKANLAIVMTGLGSVWLVIRDLFHIH